MVLKYTSSFFTKIGELMAEIFLWVLKFAFQSFVLVEAILNIYKYENEFFMWKTVVQFNYNRNKPHV